MGKYYAVVPVVVAQGMTFGVFKIVDMGVVPTHRSRHQHIKHRLVYPITRIKYMSENVVFHFEGEVTGGSIFLL